MKPGLLIFLLAVSNVLVWSPFAGKSRIGSSVSFFDVGQGDSALIRAHGVDILVDSGSGKGVLYGLQKSLPKTDKRIDLVVVSHPHADHYGGLEYVLSDYEVGALVWNGARSSDGLNKILEMARKEGVPTVDLFSGSSIGSKTLGIKVVYPPRGTDEEILAGNDGSLVMFAELGEELSGLFTGDIARGAEPTVSAIRFPKIDFLKVAHHGSNASSSYSFIAAAKPSVAFLSVGKNNYGLPDGEVIGRFATLNVPLFRTDENGGMRLTRTGGKLRVESLE